MSRNFRTSLFAAIAAASLVLAAVQPPGQGVSDGADTVRLWVDHVGATLSTFSTPGASVTK